MTDALTLCVRTPIFTGEDGVQHERYAGVNAVSDHGATHGKKSEHYLALFRAVREAARSAMAATGWETWPHPCAVEIVRYHRTRRMSDAGNIGKAELDALAPSTPNQERRDRCAPFAGVYRNDCLARPHRTDVEYDPDGPDRVLIIVRRRFPDVLDADWSRPRAPRAKAAPGTPSVPVILFGSTARIFPSPTFSRASVDHGLRSAAKEHSLKYRQKVTVEAVKWNGKNLDEIRGLIGITAKGAVIRGKLVIHEFPDLPNVNVGDYVVLREDCGDDLVVSVVRGKVFEASYEAVG